MEIFGKFSIREIAKFWYRDIKEFIVGSEMPTFVIRGSQRCCKKSTMTNNQILDTNGSLMFIP